MEPSINNELVDALVTRVLSIEDITLGTEKTPYLVRYRGLLRQDSETAAVIQDKLFLMSGDAKQLLAAIAAQDKDVIYLDPMYPPRTKSALVKKEMRLLRGLVGDDGDTSQLLAIALRQAQKRVVVKRPRLAPPLQGPPPSIAIESKNTRYDIYLQNP